MKAAPFNFVGFLRWLGIALVVGTSLEIASVIIVDPYGLYNIVNRVGLNAIKPRLTRYHNEIKVTQAVEMRVNGVILGNSRAEVGFDPDSQFLSTHGASFYNLAIPGTSIQTARRQLEYLHAVGIKPKTVIIGVEFLDFMVAEGGNRVPLSGPSPDGAAHPASRKIWRFDTLFSLTSVKDVVHTLLIQDDAEAATVSRKGFNPLKEYRTFARNDGYYAIFLQKAQENARVYLKKASGSLARTDFQHLRAILDTSARTNSEVKLVIYPYHAQILVMFEETGLWPAFTQWKEMLVNEVVAARNRHPTANITLTDFSGYGKYNCERIPAHSERAATTRWYWEAGHFKKELGDIVLSSMFRSASTPNELEGTISDTGQKFGVRLDVSNRIDNGRRILSERAECLASYPELFAETKTLVMKARENSAGY